MSNHARHFPFAGYVVAVASVAAMVAVRSGIFFIAGRETPMILLFVLPLILASWYGGTGPAILSTALGALVGDLFLYDASIPLTTRVLRIVLFLMVAGIINKLVQSRREAIDLLNRFVLHSVNEAPSDSAGDLGGTTLREKDLSIWPPLMQFACITALFALFEMVKEFSRPDFTKWQSHILSILMVGLISAIVTYRARGLMQRQLVLTALIANQLKKRDRDAAKLALVASRTSNAVIITDAAGRIDWVNLSAERLVGKPSAELTGTPVADLLATLGAGTDALAAIHDAFAHGRGCTRELLATCPGGGPRECWLLLDIQPVHDDAGQLQRFTLMATDITDHKRIMNALRQSEERNRAIIDTALDAVIFLDDQWTVIGWNPQAQAIFGFKRREVLHRPFTVIAVAPEMRPQLHTLIKELTAGATRRLEIQAVRSDGAPFPAEVSISTMHVGEHLAYSVFVRDISQRKRSEALLSQALSEAEAASRAKSEFLANMSHEMRTPLNGVIGSLALVLDAELGPREHRFLELAHTSAHSLLEQINDILDFSKIEAGKLELDHAEFDLIDALEDVLELQAPRAEQKKLELAWDIAPNVPACVRGDSARLRQILVNLVSNAIKFTQSGSVIVRLAASDHARPGDMATIDLNFSVEDTGIGIPADRLGRLFKSFSQVDASMTRKFGGTGLGLAIASRLVELMGGKITVRSTPGVGSTFSFSIALEPTSWKKVLPAAVPAIDGLKILILDGHQAYRESLLAQVRSWGFQAEAASDAPAATQLLQAAAAAGQPYGIALVDATTLTAHRTSIGQALDQLDPSHLTHLVLLTPFDYDVPVRDREKVHALLAKPARRSHLFDAIVTAAGHGGAPESPRRTRLPAPAALANGKRLLLVEDNTINQAVAVEILRRLGYDCHVAGDGRQAVDAVSREPYDLVLMDCQMPEMDGFQATRAIRDLEAQSHTASPHSHLPIIALTAHALKGDQQRCLQAGMDAFLTKPINPDELAATVARCLMPTAVPPAPGGMPSGAGAALGMITERAATPSPSPLNNDPIDIPALLRRCSGDVSFLKHALGIFESQSLTMLEQLVVDAKAGNAQQVALTAHGFKGTAATLSAEALRHHAAAIESLARAGNFADLQTPLQNLEIELHRCLAFIPTVLAANSVNTKL